MLVDEADNEIGSAEKLSAHEAPGQLHRAVSVFLFDSSGRLLLQRRAASKHHFQGLWGNTACSHPWPGETVVEAGERRLAEEMGIKASLKPVGWFVYRAEDGVSGLVEHELDHVLVGVSDDEPVLDPSEADAFDHVEPTELARRLSDGEPGFVPWLPLAIEAFPALVDGSWANFRQERAHPRAGA